MDSSDAALVFLVLGLALSAAELIAPGLILLPFGIGAVVASVTGFVGAPLGFQAVVFVVASTVFFLALRPIARRLNESDQDDGIGARRLVGARAMVLEDIPRDDSGMVRIDREHWRAESLDDTRIPSGTPVLVTEVRGTRVIVTPEQPEQLAAPTEPPSQTEPPTRGEAQ